MGSPHLGCPASTAGTCLPSPWPSPSPPTVAFAIAPSSLPAMSRYRDAQLPSPSATAMRSSPMPASPRLRSMPCHACSATAMRSPLPWPRCLSRYRDAQLPSPSPPMQSKTVALAPMPASMPSRSRLPLPACVFAPGHVTLPRCSVAFAISPDAVQDRFRLSCGKLAPGLTPSAPGLRLRSRPCHATAMRSCLRHQPRCSPRPL